MDNGNLRVAIVGCGNISGRYGETLQAYDTVSIVGATDVDADRALAFVERFGGTAYASLGDVLADPDVDAVINLTSHGAHADVTAQSLQAGKHVHSEKPLAGSYAEARRLLELAEASGVRLSCSPITFMGEAQETAWRMVSSGAIGVVRIVYAEVNWGRIERWHPAPAPFYGVGPLVDVGVYPLTILTAMFGPARTVRAYGRVVLPDRTSASGEAFHVETPDFGVAVIELESGPVVRLTTSFYVGQHSKQSGIEFHGDGGSLFLESWQHFDSPAAAGRVRRLVRADRACLAAVCRDRLGTSSCRAGRRDPDGAAAPGARRPRGPRDRDPRRRRRISLRRRRLRAGGVVVRRRRRSRGTVAGGLM